MTLPFIYILTGWFVIVGVFGLIAVLASLQMLRCGVREGGTQGFTLVFMIVGLIVFLSSTAYLVRVDWTQTVDAQAVFNSLMNVR